MRKPVTLLLTSIAAVACFAPARATAPTSRPVKILPQNQQALLYFGVYEVAVDELAAQKTVPADLHQKLARRIAAGLADADAILAKSPPPAGGAAGVQQSAGLSQQVSQLTRDCVRDIRQLLDRGQFQAFDERARITMEEVLSLQVVKADTIYVRRDLLDRVGLSDEQRRRVDALLESWHKQMAQLLRTYPYRADDGRGSYFSTELAFQTRQSLRGMLTAEQLKRWDQEILQKAGGKSAR